MEKEQGLKFGKWKQANPDKKFRDFFAENLKLKIKKDLKHNSLGRDLKTGEFGENGAKFFQKIVAYGISPEDTCVDYGCGTLRLGYHAMNHLEPGRYWGLEIADFLLDEGRALLGEQMLAEKRPNLRVISPESVAEAAACKPQMLFSVRVLKSVHPDELEEYFGNIAQIIGTWGRAVIQGHWSDNDTFKYGKRKWGHGMPRIVEIISGLGCKMTIRNDVPSMEGTRMLRHGMFCMQHQSNALPSLPEPHQDGLVAAGADEAE